MKDIKVLLVGTGQMAVDYADVLKSLETQFEVVGRGDTSSNFFFEKTGIRAITGGLGPWLMKTGLGRPEFAIVAVGVDDLYSVTTLLIESGFKNILLEKPGGLRSEEIGKLSNLSNSHNARVYVAYNRRFYSSTLKALDIISTDGGIKSFVFEFTEWSHVLAKLDKSVAVKENWFLCNSSHVADLAFFLAGRPKEIVSYHSGSLNWHSRASVFTGAGISQSGALFSYHANWGAPGRWGLELLTDSNRLIFRPLEKLQIQKIGSVAQEFVELEEHLDIQFKPGIFRQVESFLKGHTGSLCTIAEQFSNCMIYDKIANYSNS